MEGFYERPCGPTNRPRSVGTMRRFMSTNEVLTLLAAGVGAGVMNSVAGGGTLLTFPALLFLGTGLDHRQRDLDCRPGSRLARERRRLPARTRRPSTMAEGASRTEPASAVLSVPGFSWRHRSEPSRPSLRSWCCSRRFSSWRRERGRGGAQRPNAEPPISATRRSLRSLQTWPGGRRSPASS